MTGGTRTQCIGLAVGLMLGCSSDSSDPSSQASSSASGASTGGEPDPTSAETGDTGPSTGGESDSDVETGAIKLDVGAEPGEDGCTKVDFLFVIDNSISMKNKQDNLIASFPGFVEAIQNDLNAKSDYHIMVVDSDAETHCTPENCTSGSLPLQTLCNIPADGYACEHQNFTACDSTLGAGVNQPAGKDASNELCEIDGGNRFIVETEPDLEQTFTCIATVGSAGAQSERPMDAMVAALGDELNGAGGCNEGFLRDDAILVVTFISDDGYFEDAGTPQQWRQALVDAKAGDDGAIVVLGLIPQYGDCPTNQMNAGNHWRELVESFGDHGIWGLVCEPDYSPFFQDAVAIIDETCDSFEPEG